VNKIASLAAKSPLRVAGLMSGTSADGVDVAVVDLGRPSGNPEARRPLRGSRPETSFGVEGGPRGRGVRVLAFDTFAYPRALRRAILEMCRPATARVDDLCHLNFVLGETFASALIRLAKREHIALESIDLVGSHGQTIYHIPQGRRFGRRRVPSTLQVAEPCVIAERTGIMTVADFRPRDIAAGGEGAPLVPYADYVLFGHRRLSRAVQNIGGIANVTYLPAGCDVAGIVAFDTGPGNMFIDRAVDIITKGRRRLDRSGRLAGRGKPNESLLENLMRHRYLNRRPPKSTGREEFGWRFADAFYRRARKIAFSV